MELKLFVWHDVLHDYGPGIMFALATDVAQARELLLKACPHVLAEDMAKEPEVYITPYADYSWGSA